MHLAPHPPPHTAQPEPGDPDRPKRCRPRRHSRSGSRQPSTEELRRAARAFARRSRAAQGLPPHVQDPEVIAKLVILFRPNPTDTDDAQQHEEGRS
jgi:hypothetical protein